MPKSKILVLDDSPEILEVLYTFLQSEYEVCTVQTAKMFIARLTSFKPDIIILDVYRTDENDGREICRKIKLNERTKHIPVILMSTNSMELENFEECEADAIIEKPFDLFSFQNLIHTIIGEKQKNPLLNLQPG